MRQLLLLRHAKSARDDPTLADRDRPLNPRGHRDAAAMRRAMREYGLVPDLVLVSPARRTMQTLEALEPWDDTPLTEPLEQLYLAGATQILSTLWNVAETVRSVLLIGHNPGLHAAAVRLAAGSAGAAAQRLADGLPTAALAEFTVSGRWSDLSAGNARLIRFVSPAELRSGGK